MANKEASKIPVNRERFNEAMKLRKTSIRKLGEDCKIDRNEKTIRRYLSEGKMPPDLLDRIGKHLNVDPDYISGIHGMEVKNKNDEHIESVLNSQLRAERFPYPELMKEQVSLGYERYFEDVLLMHDISMSQFFALSVEKRQELQLEIERAITSTILKYFECDARGRDGLPYLQYLEYKIDSDNPFDNPYGITWRIGEK